MAIRLWSLTLWHILLAVIPLWLGGCRRAPLVSVELLNRTGAACLDVTIILNGNSHGLGWCAPNSNSSITGGWPYPMPANAEIRWVTEDNTRYSAKLVLPPASARRADFLDYTFVILPNGRADVAVVAWSDESDRVADSDSLSRDGGPNYRGALKNTTGGNVQGVDVRFGPYAVNAGTTLNAAGQNYSIATGLPYPVTRLVSLRWVTSGDQSWAKVVDIGDVLPSDLNGKCFWFILGERGSVRVQIVEWNNLRAGKHPELCRGF
jgi:hypothetical protein